MLCSDIDDDGYPDIYVANDSTPNFLYHNNGDGTFKEVGFVSGAAVNGDGSEQGSMGVTVGDYDHDGKFDLFVHEALAPWDIAAAALIAREAGAVVRSLRTGGDAAWDEPQVVIGNPKIVHDLLTKIPGLVRTPRR